MITEKACLWNNGQFYYGQWMDKKIHGFGIYITNSAIIYGQFKYGFLDGYCRLQFEDHSYYSYFQEGQQYGIQKLVYCNEVNLKGINIRNDKALIAQLDKTYFINQLKTQLKHWKECDIGTYFSEMLISKQRGGLGLMIEQNGRIQYGNFLDQQLDGIGGIVFDSGDRYHGNLKFGQLNGLGIFYNRVEKQFISGRFKENQMVEIGKMSLKPDYNSSYWHQKDVPKLVRDKQLRNQIFWEQEDKVKQPIYFTPEKIRSVSHNNVSKGKQFSSSQSQQTFGEFQYHFSSNKLKNQVIEAHFSDKKQQQNYYSSIHQHKHQIIEEQIKQKIMKIFDQDRLLQ